MHESVHLSSGGRTWNRNTPRDMLRQRLQMRFSARHIHAGIAGPAGLQDQGTHSKPLLRRGCRQLHRNCMKYWCYALNLVTAPAILRMQTI